jgi:hypothetical protein
MTVAFFGAFRGRVLTCFIQFYKYFAPKGAFASSPAFSDFLVPYFLFDISYSFIFHCVRKMAFPLNIITARTCCRFLPFISTNISHLKALLQFRISPFLLNLSLLSKLSSFPLRGNKKGAVQFTRHCEAEARGRGNLTKCGITSNFPSPFLQCRRHDRIIES